MSGKNKTASFKKGGKRGTKAVKAERMHTAGQGEQDAQPAP